MKKWNKERKGRRDKRYLILVNVEAAELLLLPFSGDVERARYKLVDQSSHHSSTEVRRSRDSEKQDPNRTLERKREEKLQISEMGASVQLRYKCLRFPQILPKVVPRHPE